MTTLLNSLSNTQANFQATQAQNTLSQLENIENKEEIQQTVKDVETLFVTHLITQMFNEVDTGGYFSGGHQEEMFKGFMIEEYGKMFTEQGGIGLSDDLQRQIILMQEGV